MVNLPFKRMPTGLVLCSCASLVGGAIVGARAAPSDSREKGPPEEAAPKIKLVMPDSGGKDKNFETWVTEEFQRLQAAAEQTSDPLQKAELLCAAANHLLATLVAPASCRLLGLPPESEPCLADAGGSLDTADKALVSAANVLATLTEGAGGDGGGAPADRVDPTTLRHKQEALSVFASAVRIALNSGSNAEDRRAAVSRLSPLREDPDPAVAAAAGLWQAYIRGAQGEADAVKAIVGSVMADPKPGTLPYAFFAKLLRCRGVAEESPAAAIALLLQLAERSQQWFGGQAQQHAVRACAWVRLQVLQAWRQRLSADSGNKEELTWCTQQIEELKSDFEIEPTVVSLSPAIPILVPPPQAAAETVVPASDGELPVEPAPDGQEPE